MTDTLPIPIPLGRSTATAGVPMTRAAAEALRAEVASLARDVELGSRAADQTGPISIDRARSLRDLDRLRAILTDAAIEDRPDVAVVGRRVTIHDRSEDATTAVRGAEPAAVAAPMTFSLVLPGDGDPSLGWVSIESPLGAAILGRRVGEPTLVSAPGGAWPALIVAVE